jgi:CTP synthase (UTP-ammonia lyase)
MKIGIIGDFDGRLSHVATNSAIADSVRDFKRKVHHEWIPTKSLIHTVEPLREFNALLCAPGSPYQSMQGALNGIRYARENMIPFLGTCGGFQHAVIEFARNVLAVSSAGHAEFEQDSADALITPLACSLFGAETEITIDRHSRSLSIYGSTSVTEKFRCNYGFSDKARKIFELSDFRVCGVDSKDQVIIMELRTHPFFIATLFQPQLSSNPEQPHLLISAFLNTAKDLRKESCYELV